MSQGWVKLHRKLLDSSLWQHPNACRVFMWLLLKARHTSGVVPFNGIDLTLPPGTIVYGRKSALAQLPDLTEQKLKTALGYLKSTSRITIKSNNKFSIITITNWDKFQPDIQLPIQPATNQQPASNQPITTNKNVLRIKELKNEEETNTDPPKREVRKHVFLSDFEIEDFKTKHDAAFIVRCAEKLSAYIASDPSEAKIQKGKNAGATFVSWVINAVKKEQMDLSRTTVGQNSKETGPSPQSRMSQYQPFVPQSPQEEHDPETKARIKALLAAATSRVKSI